VSVTLQGTEGATGTFFSPDGRSIGFIADRKLKRVALDGGAVVTICDVPEEVRGGSWGDGDIIVFADLFGSLLRVRAGGGRVDALTSLDSGEFTHRWPQVLPGGKAVLFTSHTGPSWWSRARVEVLTLADGKRKRLVERATFGRFVADADGGGYLTFVRSGALFVAAFDPVRLELLSSPIPVLEQVASDNSGAAQIDGSRNGVVVVRRKVAVNVAWLESAGSRPLFQGPGDYRGPEISHDGQRISYSAGEDIWVYDVTRDMRTQVTKGLAVAGSKPWTPDDRFIVFSTPEASGTTGPTEDPSHDCCCRQTHLSCAWPHPSAAMPTVLLVSRSPPSFPGVDWGRTSGPCRSRLTVPAYVPVSPSPSSGRRTTSAISTSHRTAD
jgi:serine/threonine-protein kinase